jgi:hypothetical protein
MCGDGSKVGCLALLPSLSLEVMFTLCVYLIFFGGNCFKLKKIFGLHQCNALFIWLTSPWHVINLCIEGAI